MRWWRSCRTRSDRTPDGTTGYDDLSRSAERRIVAGIEVQLAAGRAKDFAALPRTLSPRGLCPEDGCAVAL